MELRTVLNPYSNGEDLPPRGTLVETHIADLHFGAIDPEKTYKILLEQYIATIEQLPRLDIISVDGDIFEHKVMSNSNTAYYATMFVANLVRIAKEKHSALILLHGTMSHDCNQLKLFYHYMNDPELEMYIITDLAFVNTHNARILCIPELYGVPEERYRQFLFGSGYYDTAFMHGTFKGSVYGDNVGNGRLFCMEDFDHCYGPIFAGHVHHPGCFEKYFYYCGCPVRYKFGEEEEKGYFVVLHNLDTQQHVAQFIPVKSYIYRTIDINDIISNDPQVVIQYIDNLKATEMIDFIKIRFNAPMDGASKSIISNKYRNSNNTFVEFTSAQEQAIIQKKQELERNDRFKFIVNDDLSDEQKFCMYVNEKEGTDFITVERLREILTSP